MDRSGDQKGPKARTYKRTKTAYRGVFTREADHPTTPKAKDTHYYIRFYAAGIPKEEYVGSAHLDGMNPKQAAVRRLERIRKETPSIREEKTEARQEAEAEKAQAQATRWTFNHIWEKYTKTKKPKGIAQDRSRYDRYIRPHIGDHRPADVAPLDLDEIRITHMTGMSPQSHKLTLRLIARLSNFARKKKLCPPLTFTVEVPEVHNEKTETLQPEETARLIEVLEEQISKATRYAPAAKVMRFAMLSAMRRSELLRLKWDQINTHTQTLTITNTKQGPDTHIPLSKAALDFLERIRTEGTTHVFTNKQGQPLTDIHKAARTLIQKAGIDPRNFRPLHGLRHHAASTAVNAGIPLYTVSQLLGHARLETTQRYAHLSNKQLQDAAEAIAEALQPPPKEK